MATFIVGGIVIFACALALAAMTKDSDKGLGCGSCHGNCSACSHHAEEHNK